MFIQSLSKYGIPATLAPPPIAPSPNGPASKRLASAPGAGGGGPEGGPMEANGSMASSSVRRLKCVCVCDRGQRLSGQTQDFQSMVMI